MRPEEVSAALRQIADRLDRSKNPDPALVAGDIRKVAAAVGAEAPDQHAVEEALYGHTADTDPYRGQGSSIWWKVFDEMGMADWIPTTDYAAVEKRAKELLDKWQPWKGMPEQKTLIQKTLNSLKENWESYKKNYMPEHLEILKSKGLM